MPAMGSQIAWVLPAALLFLLTLLWIGRRMPRTDRQRASMLLWGGWLLVTGAVFSLAQGIIHPYYTVALAPAIGALAGIGTTTLWRLRSTPLARAALATGSACTAVWAYLLLDRAPHWQPWLRVAVLIGGLVCAGALALPAQARRRIGLVVATVAVVFGLAAPAAYALETAATPHRGAIPSAGPQGGGFGGPGFGGPGFAGPGFAGHGFRGTGPGGRAPALPGHGVHHHGFSGPGFPAGNAPGGIGGLLNGTTSNVALNALLARDADRYTWVAAAVGSNTAAGFQLATGHPVMPVGGFNGSDPSPTMAQFQQDVARGEIHYFIGGGGFGGQHGGSSTSRQIAAWVQQNFTATRVGNATVYDLTVER